MKNVFIALAIVLISSNPVKANDKIVSNINCSDCNTITEHSNPTKNDNIPSNRSAVHFDSNSSGNIVVAEEQLFYRAIVGTWTIIGHPGNSNLNPACVIVRRWQDGSEFHLIRDIKDGELYIRIDNMTWNIGDPIGEYGRNPGTNPIRMNFKFSNSINSSTLIWNLVSKNAITIRHLNVKNFITDFMAASHLSFIMPGTIQNADFDLNGTREAVEHMIRCYSTKANPGQKA